MKLTELKELAKQMGLRGTSTMRKPELVATLQAARSGGAAPAGVTVRPVKTPVRKPETTSDNNAPAAQQPAAQSEADTTDRQSEPVVRTVRTSKRVSRQSGAPTVTVQPADTTADQPAASHRRGTDSGRAAEVAASLFDELNISASDGAPKHRTGDDRSDSRDSRESRFSMDFDGFDSGTQRRRRRNFESRGDRADRGETRGSETVRDLDDILATLPVQNADNDRRADRDSRDDEGRDDFVRRTRDRGETRGTMNGDRRQRRLRGRDHFDERSDRAERTDTRVERQEPNDDLVPVAGIVDVLESYAFVRTSGYLPGPNDVYISMGQVKKYGLRKGDAVQGSIRAPREGERRNQRQKFVPLQSVDTINGLSVEDAQNRPQFAKLTPLYPQERLKMETTPTKLTGRLIDIVSPIGKGQRGLIVSPPKAGKTITLQNIANSITTNNPEVHLMVVLVDERPEEVTDMERTVQGEVIASTFDRPASDHTTVAELAIERAKRLVELGQDVVVLLDSMTRLARAYNIAAPASGRILSGGVDAQALYPPKKFFGAARNIENGGSLTIISSALVETGSKMDEVIFEEFKGTGNMELRLSRELADKRLFPAIDVNASGTRREELITSPQELPIIYRLRRLLGGMEPEQAYQTLVPRLKKTATNRDFLAAIVQQANGNAVNGN
ncbi:transcription termination factor Rho [Bifidobacterium leontopitheci]|uniref:Transcription termination factor Rho n=2 Tax=Bifidobacterium leontopitheci TaxID=2650774 RepID=A0A6I1GHA2_9BIFI|nr:transcription termination factor Rho [Bifidobacterium leontopitheci]